MADTNTIIEVEDFDMALARLVWVAKKDTH
jgi:hypothetical protein